MFVSKDVDLQELLCRPDYIYPWFNSVSILWIHIRMNADGTAKRSFAYAPSLQHRVDDFIETFTLHTFTPHFDDNFRKIKISAKLGLTIILYCDKIQSVV